MKKLTTLVIVVFFLIGCLLNVDDQVPGSEPDDGNDGYVGDISDDDYGPSDPAPVPEDDESEDPPEVYYPCWWCN